MSTWMLVAGAVGFTAPTMMLGPWMWSSIWTTCGWGRNAGGKPGEEAPRDERR
jgi:hypothetical protein